MYISTLRCTVDLNRVKTKNPDLAHTFAIIQVASPAYSTRATSLKHLSNYSDDCCSAHIDA